MSFRHSTGSVPPPIAARRRRRARVVAGVAVGALTLTALIGGPSFASHGDVSLAGSDFEIDTDANLKVDHAAPSEDWASVANDLADDPNDDANPEKRKLDDPSGASDNSFGQGSKEDTAVPTVVAGGIPPNKSDLKTFGLYFEPTAGDDFLHLFWHRVQDPSGTTNMDFEFNQSDVDSGNGVTPDRTAGDLLIQYDLANGGTEPELFLSEWIASGPKSLCEAANATPCWGKRISLSDSGDATGSINMSAIPAAESDGLGDVSPRTFGEATVNFSKIVGEGCVAFGSAYLKSRSSDSFTAAMKDFIAPQETGIDNCGALKIVKTRKHAAANPTTQPHAGVEFAVSGGTLPAGTKVTTNDAGVACLAGIDPGSYTVTETVPAGYAVTSQNPQTANVVADSTCDGAATVTFTNMPLTDLTVMVNSQIDGGTFSTVDCEPSSTDPDLPKTSGNGDGTVTLQNLLPATYTCTVVIDP